MSILDQLKKTTPEATKTVAKDSLDRFNDKYLFCLEYYVTDAVLIKNIEERISNVFFVSVNIDGFFTVKYNATGNGQFEQIKELGFHKLETYFNFVYTHDSDALKLFKCVLECTDFIRPNELSPGVRGVRLKRSDIKGEVILLNSNGNMGLHSSIFGLSKRDEDKKAIFHLLYLLRGKESENSETIEREIDRLHWISTHNYDLKHNFRISGGYHYQYKFDTNITSPIKKKQEESPLGGYAFTICTHSANLKGRSLRDLALRILLMKSFLSETRIDSRQVYTDSHVISITSPTQALNFCLNGAYFKERRHWITGNLDELGIMRDYVNHLYDTHRIELDYDFDQFSETITDFVNNIKIEDIDAYIKRRATVNGNYKGIRII